MPYQLPDLPYDYAALEPHIDEQTMRIHHDKHHQAYVDNANKALEGTEWADRPVEAILGDLDLIPEDKRTAVRNNAGGHANHSLFWEIISPEGCGAAQLPTLEGTPRCRCLRRARGLDVDLEGPLQDFERLVLAALLLEQLRHLRVHVADVRAAALAEVLGRDLVELERPPTVADL